MKSCVIGLSLLHHIQLFFCYVNKELSRYIFKNGYNLININSIQLSKNVKLKKKKVNLSSSISLVVFSFSNSINQG